MVDDENLVSKQFPELFHYTNVSAFENICKTQQLWATYYEDLNDCTELARFSLKVREFIYPKIRLIFDERIRRDAEFAADVNRHGGVDMVVNEEAGRFLEIIHRDTFGKLGLEIFVCSFCTHVAQSYEATHGLLSQCRGYGANGGVAIVLGTLDIEERMRRERDIFAHLVNHAGDVIYDSIDNDERIKNDFKIGFEQLPQIAHVLYPNHKSLLPEDLGPLFEKMFYPYVAGSTLVKHHAFHEENEVRIVVAPRPTSKDSLFYTSEHESKPSKDIRYKEKGDRELRYIELFGDAPLPIKRIIVGPSRIQNVNFQRITDILKNIKGENPDIPDSKVVKSEIPFTGE